MARINIEDHWFSDPRRDFLKEKINQTYRYIDGFMLEVWRLAQRYYKVNKIGIPLPVFDKMSYAQDLLESGLAEVKKGFVYIKGSKEQFSWLVKLKRAGKKGGKMTKKGYFSTSPVNSGNHSESTQSLFKPSTSLSNPLTLTPSLTLTQKKKRESNKHPADAPPPLLEIWNLNRGKLSEARFARGKRQQQVNARWQENPSQEYWVEVVQRISASEFCNGKNDRGWKATFSWLLKPDTHLKVMEGMYGDRKQSGPKIIG